MRWARAGLPGRGFSVVLYWLLPAGWKDWDFRFPAGWLLLMVAGVVSALYFPTHLC